MPFPIPEQILLTKRNPNNLSDFEFFITLKQEALPKFCNQCGVLGHKAGYCRRRGEVGSYVAMQSVYMGRNTVQRTER